MSWRGFKKAVTRLPENTKQLVGASKETVDESFQLHDTRLKGMDEDMQKFLGQAKQFRNAVPMLLGHQLQIARLLKEQYEANGEFDQGRSSHKAASAVAIYYDTIENMEQDISSILLRLDSRVINPIVETLSLLKSVRKLIVKRSHKLLDLTRHTNSMDKLRNKANRDLSDEKNLFKYEDLVSEAQQEYSAIHDALMEEMPKLWELERQLTLPLFYAFYECQSQVYQTYHSNMDKMRSVGSLDFNSSVIDGYESRSGEIDQLMETMNNSKTGLMRKNTTGSVMSRLSRRTTTSSSSGKNGNSPKNSEAPGSPTGFLSPNQQAAGTSSHHRSLSNPNPPPYSSNPTSPIMRPPGSTPTSPLKKPPPPPVRPLPKAKALYDYDAQAEGDLSLREGDILDVIKRTDSTNDWWTGRLGGRIGNFPDTTLIVVCNDITS